MSPLNRTGTFAVLLFLMVVGAAAVAQTPTPDADQHPYPTLPPLAPPTGRGTELPPPSGEGRGEGKSQAALIPWSRLIYYARAGGNWDIFSSDDQGESLVRLTTDPAVDVQPDLSRGGATIVFVSDADGDFDLYTLGSAGRARLLDTPADEYDPVWSPDGGRIAFRSERDGQPEIYVIDADGGNLTRLTNNSDFDGHPTWSPDGARLAFASRRDGQYRIWVMNADGGGLARLSDQPGSMYPAWSPGGETIAFSGDANGDGWLDLFTMRDDGEIESEIQRAPANQDLMPRSWAPDASEVAYTIAYYALTQGQWLVVDSRLEHIFIGASHGTQFYTPVDYPFAPVWQTLDNEAPVTAVAPLPSVSPSPFTVSWSAADAGGSGLATVEVQVSVDGGPWATWLAGASGNSAEYILGRGGQTIAFRMRAADSALNREPWPAAAEAMTTVEALPPVTTLSPLPAYSRIDREFLLTWRGFDPGHSGINAYEMQWRRGAAGWQAYAGWPTSATLETIFRPAESGVTAGQTVGFRLRADDLALNVEPWPADPGDAVTTFYRWSAVGRVVDNAGAPVAGATVTTDPATLGPAISTPDGEYARYLATQATAVTLDWAKPGYGDLPPTTFATGLDVAPTIALPPAANALADGSFEAGWGAWAAGGAPLPTLSAGARHTGATGAQLAASPLPFAAQQRLSATPDEPESNPSLGINGAAVTVLWTEGIPDGTMLLRYSRREGNGAWAGDELLTIYDYRYVSVTDSSGNLHVVARTANGLVYLRQNGATWSTPQPVPGSVPSQDPYVVMGSNGVLHLLWMVYEGDNETLRHSSLPPGGTWSAPFDVVTFSLTNNIFGLGAAVAPDGALTVIYYTIGEEEDRLSARVRRANGTWTPTATIQTADRMAINLSGPPVVDGNGRVHFLWTQSVRDDPEPYRIDLYYAQSQGGTWTSPQRVFCNAGVGSYVAGLGGTVHALLGWDNELRYTARLPDGLWLFPEAVPGDTFGDAELVVDAAGLPHIIRGSFDGEYTYGDLQYTYRLSSGVWTPAVSVSTLFNKNYRPAAAIDAGGNVHVVWLAEDEQTADLRSDVVYAGPGLAPTATETTISRSVTVPVDNAHTVLSFFYRFGGGATDDTRLVAEVTGGSSGQAWALPPTGDEMKQALLDVSGNAGQAVTVTFRLTQAAGEPSAAGDVDDVTLGAAHGDVWLAGAGGAALPGQTTTHELSVGNRGGVDADDVAVTYTLPPELSFVSADPAPNGLTPLLWELGTLAADETRTIRVIVSVAPTAAPFAALSATAAAVSPGELETHNNSVEVITRTETSVFLSVVIR